MLVGTSPPISLFNKRAQKLRYSVNVPHHTDMSQLKQSWNTSKDRMWTQEQPTQFRKEILPRAKYLS